MQTQFLGELRRSLSNSCDIGEIVTSAKSCDISESELNQRNIKETSWTSHLTARQKEPQQRTREFIAEKIIPFERDKRNTAHGPTEDLRAEVGGAGARSRSAHAARVA